MIEEKTKVMMITWNIKKSKKRRKSSSKRNSVRNMALLAVVKVSSSNHSKNHNLLGLLPTSRSMQTTPLRKLCT